MGGSPNTPTAFRRFRVLASGALNWGSGAAASDTRAHPGAVRWPTSLARRLARCGPSRCGVENRFLRKVGPAASCQASIGLAHNATIRIDIPGSGRNSRLRRSGRPPASRRDPGVCRSSATKDQLAVGWSDRRRRGSRAGSPRRDESSISPPIRTRSATSAVSRRLATSTACATLPTRR
jgi:hypothetical protein